MRRLRVLILSQYYWPEAFRITELASALRDAGASVTILTGQPNYPDGVIAPGYRALSVRHERHDGLDIYRVPLAPRGQRSAVGLILNYASFVLSAALVGPWQLRGQPFDVVLVYAPSPILQAIPAIWIARLKSARVVTWVQDLWPESLAATGFVRNARALAAVGRLVNWIYRRHDLLLAQSTAFVPAIAARAGATPVEYFPNPGERAFSVVGASTPSALTLDAGFNVVFAGNLGSVQALETVIDAATLLRDTPDVHLVLVGSGSRDAWLRAEVARRGLTNVRLPGRFPPDELPAILAQASALLVSLSRDPTLALTVPSKVQAYLAAGRPVIAALDGEGARVVEEAGAGVSVPAEDAPALASAILRLRAMDGAARASMGQRGRLYYEREFAPDVLARRLHALLSRLVAHDGLRTDSDLPHSLDANS